jgi:adenosyl cobinamide kinase/adenosyl cobinamide phosphate guanylyltransferase
MFHADREKGDSPHLCAAPYGPFRQMGTVPFSGRGLAEADVAQECGSVLDAAEAVRGTVIFVTNEVGLGVVPENALARRYRDLLGRANQTIAARAGTVTLLCCGIPLHLKVKT